MKKFENADIIALDLSATEYGPVWTDEPDGPKEQVVHEDGTMGWEQKHGKKS